MSRSSLRFASLAIAAFTMLPLGASGQPVVVVDGSSNPELISNEALYLALSGFLEGAAPSDCSSGVLDDSLTQLVDAFLSGFDANRAREGTKPGV